MHTFATFEDVETGTYAVVAVSQIQHIEGVDGLSTIIHLTSGDFFNVTGDLAATLDRIAAAIDVHENDLHEASLEYDLNL